MGVCIPSILRVETGFITSNSPGNPDYLDYNVYRDYPRWLRSIEQKLRMDIYLAVRARKISNNYDIVWSKSEKAGIPLSFMNLQTPLVMNAHNLELPIRARFIKLSGIARKWTAVGYFTENQMNFLTEKLNIKQEYLFRAISPTFLEL